MGRRSRPIAQGSNTLGASVGNHRTMLKPQGKTMQEFADSEIKGEEQKSTDFPELAVDPFHIKAEKEAEEDRLLGFSRDQEWINNRAKKLADEDFKKPADDPTRIAKDYFKVDNLTDIMTQGAEFALDSQTQIKFVKWMNDHDKKTIDKFCETYTPEEVFKKQKEEECEIFKKQIKDDYEIRLKVEKNKLNEDHRQAALATLTLLKSSLFLIMVPIVGMLPEPYNRLSIVVVFYVIWLNWPMVKACNKLMKEHKKKMAEEEKAKKGKEEFGSDVYGSIPEKSESKHGGPI